jgi:hypothetical protein
VDHLDDLSVAERREVGDPRAWLAWRGRGSHDHDDLVAGIDHVDELDGGPAPERSAHELERLIAIAAGTVRVGIATVSLHFRIQQIRNDV